MPKDLRKEIYRSGMPDREAAAAAAMRDQKDRMIKTFMQFVSDDKEETVSADDLKDVKEDFAAPAASTVNTPGMGNVSAPSVGSVGSGDVFNNGKADDEDESEDNPNSFKSFIKKIKQFNGKG